MIYASSCMYVILLIINAYLEKVHIKMNTKQYYKNKKKIFLYFRSTLKHYK
jgi:hypothetical protein